MSEEKQVIVEKGLNTLQLVQGFGWKDRLQVLRGKSLIVQLEVKITQKEGGDYGIENRRMNTFFDRPKNLIVASEHGKL